MIRLLSIIFFFFFSASIIYGQFGIVVETGLNRVGWYNKAAAVVEFSNHQLLTGIKLYSFDYVFEKNTPGVSLSYNYNFSKEQLYISGGFSGAFFTEKKTTTRFFLIETGLQMKIGMTFKTNWSVYGKLGASVISNKHSQHYLSSIPTISYLSYDLGLGILYRFNKKVN